MDEKFTAETIAAAERLLGVSYTAAERALMADNLAAQIGLAVSRRAVALPRELPPATVFDPRLPGWKAPATGAFRPSKPPVTPLPARDEDIAFASVGALGAWLRSGALTSVRLTEIYLARIARLGPQLECIAVATPELAREQAKRAD